MKQFKAEFAIAGEIAARIHHDGLKRDRSLRLGEFAEGMLEWDPRPAVCVVMASQGYPGGYAKGKVISGLGEAAKLPDIKVFHAGTKIENNLIVTDGGRVLGVTALHDTLAQAKERAYEAVSKISFQGAFYRKDIADKALRP